MKAPALESVGRVARRVAARLVDHAELGGRRARAGELAVVGVPLARGVLDPAHRRRSSRRFSTFSRGAVAVECRSNRVPRPTSSSESASRTSSRRFVRFSRATSALAPRWSGPPGVRPLLGAGRHQPDVARGLRPGGQRAGERDQRPDAGRVVVGPGRGRDGVRVRHRDHQAVARARRGSRSRRATVPCPARRSARTRPAARPSESAPPPAGARRARPPTRPAAARAARARPRSCALPPPTVRRRRRQRTARQKCGQHGARVP